MNVNEPLVIDDIDMHQRKPWIPPTLEPLAVRGSNPQILFEDEGGISSTS